MTTGSNADSVRESMQKQIDAEHVNDFINMMTSGGRTQMVADHDQLRKKERHVYYFMRNPTRNRFSNVLLFNEGAIILDKHHKDETQYIHATRIKSTFGNYVLAQAPKSDTLLEWYRMIWQCRTQIIICLLPLDNGKECHKYFEKKAGKKVKCKRFTMKTSMIRQDGPMNVYEMRMTNSDAKGEEKERILYIIHYPKWQIGKQPDPRQLLKVMRSMWALESALKMANEKCEVTVLVHGCSGVRRTGAFVVSSMLCKQIRDRQTVSIVAACSTVRRYRYGVMRNKQVFCTVLEMVFNFAADQGLVDRMNQNFVNCIKKTREALLDRESGSRTRRDRDN
ncbi:Tyrosine-protein phosphatase non-receptor type 5 [Aphelenchoides besseyi]|nr:Tyrosine-protein phosphatase non-receptor type 5 [Aphelenchoides besseyi]